MKHWLDYFNYNRSHRREIPWSRGIDIPAAMLAPFIRSLQKFQIGESGEGRHLRKRAATTNDPVYIQCIDLFIKEEQEHARLMAVALKILGAKLLTHHWSDSCFILLRRLFGLNQELLVLLMPEMIAKRYFRALRDGTPDPVLRAMCGQILQDEEGHLAFHIDFLQRAFASKSILSRFLLRTTWRLLYRAACLVVIVDHRHILRQTGVSLSAFWWDCGLIFDEVAAEILSCAPSPGFVRPNPALPAE